MEVTVWGNTWLEVLALMCIKLNVFSVIWFIENSRGMFSRVLNFKLCLDLLCNNLGDAEDLELVEWQNIYLEIGCHTSL